MSEFKNEKKASFFYTLKAVFWSFFGLRRNSDFEADAVKINPFHIVIAGLIGVACFIGLLVTIVKFAVAR